MDDESSQSPMSAAFARAIKGHELVRITRGIPGADDLWGFILEVGTRWVLLAQFERNMFTFDGYSAVRLADATDVECKGVPSSIEGRVLKAKGQWPPPRVRLPLNTTTDLIRRAAELSPLVEIHTEREDPGLCFVGAPVRFGAREVLLQEVTPDAEWHDDGPSQFLVEDVTRVDFLTQYSQGLALVAPPRPE